MKQLLHGGRHFFLLLLVIFANLVTWAVSAPAPVGANKRLSNGVVGRGVFDTGAVKPEVKYTIPSIVLPDTHVGGMELAGLSSLRLPRKVSSTAQDCLSTVISDKLPPSGSARSFKPQLIQRQATATETLSSSKASANAKAIAQASAQASTEAKNARTARIKKIVAIPVSIVVGITFIAGSLTLILSMMGGGGGWFGHEIPEDPTEPAKVAPTTSLTLPEAEKDLQGEEKEQTDPPFDSTQEEVARWQSEQSEEEHEGSDQFVIVRRGEGGQIEDGDLEGSENECNLAPDHPEDDANISTYDTPRPSISRSSSPSFEFCRNSVYSMESRSSGRSVLPATRSGLHARPYGFI